MNLHTGISSGYAWSEIVFISYIYFSASNLRSMTIEQEPWAEHRLYLLRFARLQLRNDSQAEDVVSETLVVALADPAAYVGRSQLRTWLVGILKHKILDALREQSRQVTLCPQDPDSDGSQELESLMFESDGHFAHPPRDWGNPEAALVSRQFLTVLEACTEKLSPQLGRVFLMREWLELSVEEICKEMGLSSTNLYVQLHRARLRLRECLDLNWFGTRT